MKIHQFNVRFGAILHWCREHCRKPNISASVGMFLIQLAGAFSVLYGISFWSVPCALIIGGISAIVAIEFQQREPGKKESPEEILAIQARIKTALASGEDPFSQPGVPLTESWVAYAVSLRRRASA